MGRPRKQVDDLDLFRWFALNCEDPSLKITAGNNAHSWQARAVSWFMHQFDAVVVFQALNKIEPTKKHTHHKPESWDVYRLLCEDIKALEDNSVNEKGLPTISPVVKMALRDRLRRYMVVGASLHPQFLHNIGKLGPDGGTDYDVEGPEQVETDPIVLSLKRDTV